MSSFHRSLVLPLGLALTLAACSGGSGGTTGQAQVRCSDGTAFCLVSCDLGCSLSGGCAVTEVAENQRLTFTFNQAIAASTVGVGTFSLRTVAGEPPDGQVLVDGATLTFVPSISVSGGTSSFGFRRNESYIITLVGGAGGIKSVSGDTLNRSHSCTVVASRGIIDDDNAPPRATLVSPTNLAAAPVNSTIILRFSEVIDTTPFLTPVTSSTPIHYVLRQSRIQPGGTDRVCNLDSEAIQLEGLPQIGVDTSTGRPVTTIGLRPSVTLPGLSCIEVQVTADVRDLAGKAAVESTFRFITAESQVADQTIIEDFAGESRMDVDVSAGNWSVGARAGQVGGDGRHGSFNPAIVQPVGSVYTWSTDSMLIPASQTFSGVADTVTNGEFFFSDFVLPDGVTLKFTGSNPVKIHVRGKVDIRGKIDTNGDALPFFLVGTQAFSTYQSRNTQPSVGNLAVAGQPGTRGGPGGASGGRGGNRCLGAGALPEFNGVDGGNLNVPAGHAYSGQVAGTGGRGSPVWPAHATTTLNPTAEYSLQSLYNRNVNFGGGGGGYMSAGANGLNVATAVVVSVPPAQTPGGSVFGLFPLPSPQPSSLQHFLIGGSGGGGGGSHCFAGANHVTLSQAQFVNDIWKAGSGGSGGGGALMIRGGRTINIGPASGTSTAGIEAKGGAGVFINGDSPTTPTVVESPIAGASLGVSAPGGGGSGGSILLQAHNQITINGALDCSGGSGSRVTGFPTTAAAFNVDVRGGAGSSGFYRLEARNGVGIIGGLQVPSFNATLNTGALVDRDLASGSRSLWRGTTFVFPPTWLRYELRVDTDGDGTVDQVYSDDPTLPGSSGPANDPLGPVRIRFQGARVSPAGVVDVATIRQWRESINDTFGPGINSDSPTGFRFDLLMNTDLFPNAVVTRLTVVARG